MGIRAWRRTNFRHGDDDEASEIIQLAEQACSAVRRLLVQLGGSSDPRPPTTFPTQPCADVESSDGDGDEDSWRS